MSKSQVMSLVFAIPSIVLSVACLLGYVGIHWGVAGFALALLATIPLSRP